MEASGPTKLNTAQQNTNSSINVQNSQADTPLSSEALQEKLEHEERKLNLEKNLAKFEVIEKDFVDIWIWKKKQAILSS